MSKLETKLEMMKEIFEDFCKNANAFLEKGNKTAGKRSRVASSKLDKLTKEWRKETVS